jgi:tetratricopeptide (TPR) repeat protein
MSYLAVRLANSGIVQGYEYVGWAYLGAYMVVYIPFVAAWFRATGDISGMEILYIIMFAVLIIPVGILGAELAAQALVPDSSKGLKLLKVNSAAERKVAEDDLPGAIAEYESALAKDPNDVAARLRMADLCQEAKEYEKAATAYEALAGKPRGLNVGQRCSVLTQLSEIYARHLGQMEKAREAVQKIIDLYPDTDYAKFAGERLKNL